MPSRDEEKSPDPQWLLWSRRLQAIAQDGLTYTRDGYDLGRYAQLRELSAEIFATLAFPPTSTRAVWGIGATTAALIPLIGSPFPFVGGASKQDRLPTAPIQP